MREDLWSPADLDRFEREDGNVSSPAVLARFEWEDGNLSSPADLVLFEHARVGFSPACQNWGERNITNHTG
ncbi:hypothetical protein TNIN_428871 [Trichonephila inaurata madagascariensis]|uniref:Uncharacterized protein n=1 Tax=Trichonephila inaurata madagascariensis TaxID=2747483 RepID=A0A8X6IUW4_9ARAC|nr:hypothetical protein TNIN_428871 [Trichonephila inaurata madagascariensis]